MAKRFSCSTRHHRKLAKLHRVSHRLKRATRNAKHKGSKCITKSQVEKTQLSQSGLNAREFGGIDISASVSGVGQLTPSKSVVSPAERALARVAGDVFAAVGAARRAVVSKFSGQKAAAFVMAAIAANRRLSSMVPPRVREDAAELNARLSHARGVLSKSTAGIAKKEPISILEVLIALDEVYYRLRYLATLIGDLDQSVPPPHHYFSDSGKAWEVGGAADANTVQSFLEIYVGPGQENVVYPFLGYPSGSEDLVENPLLQLLQTRWRESIVRLAYSGLVPSQLHMCQPTQEQNSQSMTMRGRDPLAGNVVRMWRDATRVWACHFYSYAVPNDKALSTICKYSPLVEIGAGTGYWSCLLRRRGATVFCYDKDPAPAFVDNLMSAAQDKVNEYHGLCRAWTQVECGDEQFAARHPGATLFLCYPPPDSPMALRALQAYSGKVVCLVGEWSGDTGTAKFQQELCRNFILHEKVTLPNWGDSAAELTVWYRSKKSSGQGLPLSCWSCRASTGSLRRCRLTYDAVFCSERCSIVPDAMEMHRASLAMRMALFTPVGASPSKLLQAMPRYENRGHFRLLG